MKQLNDREFMFLSDLLNGASDNIKTELEAYQDEANNFEQPEDMEDIINEMQQDQAICNNLMKKFNIQTKAG